MGIFVQKESFFSSHRYSNLLSKFSLKGWQISKTINKWLMKRTMFTQTKGEIHLIAIESSKCGLRAAGDIYFSDGNNDSSLLYLKQNNPKLGTSCKPHAYRCTSN
jgi:hypothetical protein